MLTTPALNRSSSTSRGNCKTEQPSVAPGMLGPHFLADFQIVIARPVPIRAELIAFVIPARAQGTSQSTIQRAWSPLVSRWPYHTDYML